ncbi:MAG TPA: pyridoxal phosphate-dependent aminotransferase [Gemmataceae bacterium]
MAYSLFLAKLLIRGGVASWVPSVRRLLGSGTNYLHYYSDRVLGAPVADMQAVAGLLEQHTGDVIDLTLGAPRFDLTPSGSTKLPADQRDWPPSGGLPELRSAVADKLRGDHGQEYDPSAEILITSGATGAFHVALETFVNRGDAVVLFDPSSPLFSLAIRHKRGRVRWVTTWMDQGRTCFRLAELAKLLHGAKLLVVNVPANPTGGVLSPDDLEQIAWWANRHDVLIYSDEVFERYLYDGEPATIATLPGARNRTLTADSVSKGHALASTRVGWLAGCRHLIRPCSLIAALQTPFVPTLCQQVALTALRQNEKFFEPIHTGFESRRRYTFEKLDALELRPAWPAGAFFFWLPVWQHNYSGREFAERLLREQRVLVTPGDLFGPSGKGYVRLSYAAEDGRLREGLRRLAQFMDCKSEAPMVSAKAA